MLEPFGWRFQQQSYFSQLTCLNFPKTWTGREFRSKDRRHPMGKRKLATRMAFKPVAAARQEAIMTPLKAADDAMRGQTPGGVFSVR